MRKEANSQQYSFSLPILHPGWEKSSNTRFSEVSTTKQTSSSKSLLELHARYTTSRRYINVQLAWISFDRKYFSALSIYSDVFWGLDSRSEALPSYGSCLDSTCTMKIDLQSYKILPFYEQANYALQAPHNQPPYQSPVLFSRVSKASTQCPSSPALAPSAQL